VFFAEVQRNLCVGVFDGVAYSGAVASFGQVQVLLGLTHRNLGGRDALFAASRPRKDWDTCWITCSRVWSSCARV